MNKPTSKDSQSAVAASSGSAAFVGEVRCEARTIDELADRIARMAATVRNGATWHVSSHSSCEVKPITEPPNAKLTSGGDNPN